MSPYTELPLEELTVGSQKLSDVEMIMKKMSNLSEEKRSHLIALFDELTLEDIDILRRAKSKCDGLVEEHNGGIVESRPANMCQPSCYILLIVIVVCFTVFWCTLVISAAIKNS